MKKQNKGAISLEYILVIIVVSLVTLGSMKMYGGKLSQTIKNSANAVTSTTNDVFNQLDNFGSGSQVIDISNIDVVQNERVLARGDFSAKGNIVTINNKTFRVLSVDGTKAKVVMMGDNDDLTSKYNNTPETIVINDKVGLKYAILDQATNDYYNSLPLKIQNAIVEQNINQSMYSWTQGTNPNADISLWYKGNFNESDTSGTNYYLERIGEVNVGNRKVYTLDLDDVVEYLGLEISPQTINEMIFNNRYAVGGFSWFCFSR